MKICSMCGESKPTDAFNRHAKTSDNLQSYCKDCTKLTRTSIKSLSNCTKEQQRANTLNREYFLTIKQAEELFQKANNACQICGRNDKALVIDHDHATGQVRGVLCQHCNHILGNAFDNIEILQKAILYLQQASKEINLGYFLNKMAPRNLR